MCVEEFEWSNNILFFSINIELLCVQMHNHVSVIIAYKLNYIY